MRSGLAELSRRLRPSTASFIVSRDAVSASDEARRFGLPVDATDPTLGDVLNALVDRFAGHRPWARVPGGGTTWVLHTGRWGGPVAVVTCDPVTVVIPIAATTTRLDPAAGLHLAYHRTEQPCQLASQLTTTSTVSVP